MSVDPEVGANASGGAAAPAERLHWIDWLRVGAIAGVFFFHTLRPFNSAGWHVKNAETTAVADFVVTFFEAFGLAVLFLLAGVGMRFALRKRSWGTFIRERTMRLLVPFIVGTLLLAPVQGYFEASQDGTLVNPAADFIGWWGMVIGWATDRGVSPTAFGIGYHLWFLGFLFAISIVALPLCMWLLRSRGRALIGALASRLCWRGASLLFVVPIYLLMGIGTAFGTEEHDWFEFAWYSAYFVVGFVLIGDARLVAGVRRDALPALAGALITTALIVMGIPVPIDRLDEADIATKLTVGGVFAVEGWCWTLVILNAGMRFRPFQRAVSERLGDAVLPVYVIHQPVILAVAFIVVGLPLGIAAKWLLVFAFSTAGTLVLVQLALRMPITRMLLGTRIRAVPQPPAAIPASRRHGPRGGAEAAHGRPG